MIQVTSSDILSLARSVRPRSEIICISLSFPNLSKLRNISYLPPCLRIGRCVMKPYLNSTFPIATQVQHSMLETMLVATIGFLRFISIANSGRSDSLRSRQLSDLVRMTRRKLRKASLQEMVSTLEQSAQSAKVIYFTIPRTIFVPDSRNAIDIANFLLLDYCGFMGTYTEQLGAQDSPIYFYLHDYLRSAMFRTGMQ